jgi:hypothetical protein
MNEKIKRKLNSGNACYVKFGPESFVFPFLFKNVTCAIYPALVFIVLYRCVTRSFTLRENQSLNVLNDRLMIAFEPTKVKTKRGWRKLQMKNFVICTSHHILLSSSNQGRYDGPGM